ncbi:host attachment protein [Lacunimicrobium album]
MSAQTATVTWILVADRAHALFFRTSKNDLSDLELVKTLDNPDGRKKAQEINTDKPGRFMGDDGSRVSGDPTTDVRHQGANDMADLALEALEAGRNHQEFEKLVIVAPSLLLGTLRKKCSGPLAKLITAEFDLEIANQSPRDIEAHLRKKLLDK